MVSISPRWAFRIVVAAVGFLPSAVLGQRRTEHARHDQDVLWRPAAFASDSTPWQNPARADDKHDSLWNGVLIGAGTGILVWSFLAAIPGDDSGDAEWVRAAATGALFGAAVGLMIDAARTN
jgi:hypothetical protein